MEIWGRHSRQREYQVECPSDICDAVTLRNNMEDRLAKNNDQEEGSRRRGQRKGAILCGALWAR